MTNAVIVDAVRTPLGRRNGTLKDTHPTDLAAHVLRALVERSDIDPGTVDDVIMGCVVQAGDQAVNIGRNAVLGAGFPDSVPATTVDRQCGSSQQALHFAAAGVSAGHYDIVIAAGVENMSRVSMGAARLEGTEPFGTLMNARYPDLVGQGVSAEMIAEQWEITREQNDQYALMSHERAARARAEGRFDNEIVALKVSTDDGERLFDADEGIRPESSMEKLAGLKTVFKENGVVTAGNASQISDGAAAVLVMSEERASALGLRPRARFHSFALAGVDPITMLTGPIPATRRVLERGGLTLDDIDLVEINEAFAPVVLAWQKEVGADLDTVNVNGGAIALGHPLGASGARLMATLLNELERTGGRYGLQTMCEGFGQANATIIERLD